MSVTSASVAYARIEPLFRTVAWGIALVMPLTMWLSEVGNPLTYWQLHSPPGQKFYTLSKLFGLLGIGLMWLQLVSKLSSHVPGMRALWRQSKVSHYRLGRLVLTTLLAHALLFVIAASLRADHLALKPMVPDFSVDFFTTAVSIGATALYLLLVAIFSVIFFLNSRRPMLKWFHRMVYVSFIFGTVHSVLIGSETRSPLALIWYCLLLSSFISVATTTLFRAKAIQRP